MNSWEFFVKGGNIHAQQEMPVRNLKGSEVVIETKTCNREVVCEIKREGERENI